MSLPMSHTLDVPGGCLYYEVQGSGPPLMLIGHPMGVSGFAAISPLLAENYTVVERTLSIRSRISRMAGVPPNMTASDGKSARAIRSVSSSFVAIGLGKERLLPTVQSVSQIRSPNKKVTRP